MPNEQSPQTINLLTDGEWMQLIKIIGLANHINEDYAFRRTILEQLRMLIPYESAAFFLTDLSKASSSPDFFSSPIGIDCEEGRLDEYVQSAWKDDKIRELLPTNESRVIRESDFVSKDEKNKSAYYSEFLGGRNVLTCTFACEKGPLGSINLNRKLHDFADKEVFILEILEPHITERLSQHRLSDGNQKDFDRFTQDHGVTAREGEVLACLLQGMSNGEISESLCISPATTRKHLENLYKKVGAKSRLELALLARKQMRGH
ncbi:MAG: helix-turn-helix transcriptional regulator [Raoultibacter sp.]